MSEPGRAAPTSSAPTDPRWELTLRVADSATFRNCPKLRPFLLYVCENAILGRFDNLREQRIGASVFGRPTNYNLAEDNIVRVEARELRRRLEMHFAGEGRSETCAIEIAKGGYVPAFLPREVAPETAAPGSGTPPAPARGFRLPRLVAALAAGAILTGAAGLWFGMRWHRTEPVPPHPEGGRTAAPAEDYAAYSDLLGPMGARAEREILIVMSNPLVMPEGGPEADDDVEQATAGPAPSGCPPILFTRREYTGTGEATTAFHFGRLTQFLGRRVRLTQARFVNWDHIQQQDLVFLGGPVANDWTYQNLRRSNFNVGDRVIENGRPLPGEQREYWLRKEPRVGNRTAMTDYGVIKMLAAPDGFRMLLLAGITSAGTAGVGEFFAAPEKMKPVHAAIRAAAPDKPFPADWEVLVKVIVRDKLPVETTAVAVRPAAPQR